MLTVLAHLKWARNAIDSCKHMIIHQTTAKEAVIKYTTACGCRNSFTKYWNPVSHDTEFTQEIILIVEVKKAFMKTTTLITNLAVECIYVAILHDQFANVQDGQDLAQQQEFHVWKI